MSNPNADKYSHKSYRKSNVQNNSYSFDISDTSTSFQTELYQNYFNNNASSRKTNQFDHLIQRSNETLQGIPQVLQTIFTFNEIIQKTLEKQQKPFTMYSTEELVEWIKPYANDLFIQYIIKKQINGNTISSLSKRKYTKCDITDAMYSKIKEEMKIIKIKTCFGNDLINNNNFSDTMLRQMYAFTSHLTGVNIFCLNQMDIYDAISLTFMTLNYYFAENIPILQQTQLLEINEFKDEKTPFDVLSCPQKELDILYRTLLFLKRMKEIPSNVFSYYQTEFETFLLKWLAPNIDIEPFKILLQYVEEPNYQIMPFERDESYGGEEIRGIIENVLLPFYLFGIRERVKELDSKCCVKGSLYITNYRVIWKDTNKTNVFKNYPNTKHLYQFPIHHMYEFDKSVIKVNEKDITFVHILSCTSHSFMFGFENNADIERFLMYCTDKESYLIDDRDVFSKDKIFCDCNLKIYEDIDNNDGIFLYSNEGFFNEKYVYLNSLFKDNKIIVVDNNEDLGNKIFRLDIGISFNDNDLLINSSPSVSNANLFNGQMKPKDLKKLEEMTGSECLKVNVPNDQQVEEYYKEFFTFVCTNDKSKYREVNDQLEFIESYFLKAMDCVSEIFEKYRTGKSLFLFSDSSQTDVCLIICLYYIMTNNYYRTFDGFLELIYIQLIESKYIYWILSNKIRPYNYNIFLHMVDNLRFSFAYQFEFNKKLLEFLSYHIFSHRFSTFSSTQEPSQSIFAELQQNKSQYVNPEYEKNEMNLIENYLQRTIVHYKPAIFFHFANHTSDKSPLMKMKTEEKMDLTDKKLMSIPTYLHEQVDFKQIKTLNLALNNLSFIPEELIGLPNLVHLNLSNNGIEYIPEWQLNGLTKLTFLDLSESKPLDIPQYENINFNILENLQMLRISNRKINSQVCFPTSIKTIIAENCMESLPETMSELCNLVSLNLSRNPRICSNQVFTLTQLTTLSLSRCNIEKIPNTISALSNLGALDLSYNRFKGLPLDLYSLKKLTKLDISFNSELKYISKLYVNLTKLQTLNLSRDDPRLTVPCKHPYLNIQDVKEQNIYSTKLNIVSDPLGLETYKKNYQEFKIKGVDISRTKNNGKHEIEIDKMYYTVRFYDINSKSQFIPASGDCYIMILMFENWETVLHSWKDYLLRFLPNDDSIVIGVLFFVDAKIDDEKEEQYVETIKRKLKHWDCDVKSLKVKNKKKLNVEEKFKKMLSGMKNVESIYTIETLAFTKEIHLSSFDPPIITEGTFVKYKNLFNIEKPLRKVIDDLHELGTLISIEKILSKNLNKNYNTGFQQLLKSEGNISKLLILDLEIFTKIYQSMFINEKTGFGYVDTVDAILNQSKTKGGEINNDVVYFFVQVLFDVFIARKEFLKQFQLEEKYQEILQTEELLYQTPIVSREIASTKLRNTPSIIQTPSPSLPITTPRLNISNRTPSVISTTPTPSFSKSLSNEESSYRLPTTVIKDTNDQSQIKLRNMPLTSSQNYTPRPTLTFNSQSPSLISQTPSISFSDYKPFSRMGIPHQLPTTMKKQTIVFNPHILAPISQRTKNDLWPTLHGDREVDFGRKITSTYIPSLFISNFLFVAFAEGLTEIRSFKNISLLRQKIDGQLFLVCIEYTNQMMIIKVRFRAQSVNSVMVGAHLMEILMKRFHEIQKKLFPLMEYEEYILCPLCLIFGESKVHCAKKKEIIDVLNNEKDDFVFSENHTCSIVLCSLDLIFRRLRKLKKTRNINMIDLTNMSLNSENQLGTGSSAKVYALDFNGFKVAAKVFSFNPSEFSQVKGEGGATNKVAHFINELRKEVRVMTLSDSSHIIQLMGLCLDPLSMIIEFCEHGTLFEYLIKKTNKLTWEMITDFMMQIANSMYILHHHKIIHRDLKSPNVLLKENDNGTLYCVLSDFGLSGVENEKECVDVDNPRWTAPEILMGMKFTLKSDVYSYAIIMYELLTREEPFYDEKSNKQIKNAILTKDKRPIWNENVHPNYKKLTEICWDKDPNKRLSFIKIIERLKELQTL